MRRLTLRARVTIVVVALSVVISGGVAGALIHKRLAQPIQSISASDAAYVELDGKFTDRKITDSQSAIAAVGDVAGVLRISDPDMELITQSETTVGNASFYRLSQQYQGIPVFGRDIVVAASTDGDALGLTSNYLPISGLDARGKLSDSDVVRVARTIYSLNDSTTCFTRLHGTAVYVTPTKAQMVHMVDVGGLSASNEVVLRRVLINDQSKMVYEKDLLEYEQVQRTLTGQQEKTHDLMVDLTGVTYTLADTTNDITVYQADHGFWTRYFNWMTGGVHSPSSVTWDLEDGARIPVQWQDGWAPDPVAVDAMASVQAAREYFEKLGGAYKNIDVVYGINSMTYDENGAEQQSGWIDNAFSTYVDGRHVIGVGQSKERLVESAGLASLGHEYTHGVVGDLTDLGIMGDSGAVNEAFSDIFGTLIANPGADPMIWNRSADHPSSVGYDKNNITKIPWLVNRPLPETWDERFQEKYAGHDLSDEEYNRVASHFNCTILSHAAYLMFSGMEGKSARIDAELLGRLWFGALLFLHSDSTFQQVRNFVELSARQLMVADSVEEQKRLTQAQYETIQAAFKAVKIENADISYSVTVSSPFNLQVIGANGGTAASCNLETLQYWDKDGRFHEKPIQYPDMYVKDGVLENIPLPEGQYLLKLTQGGHTPIQIRLVVVGPDESDTDTITVSTDFDSLYAVNQQPSGGSPSQSGTEATCSFAEVIPKVLLLNHSYPAEYIDEDGLLTIPRIDLTGVINYKIADFDGDGQNEMLTLTIEPYQVGDKSGDDWGSVNPIYAHMFEMNSCVPFDAGSMLLASNVLGTPLNRVDMFLASQPGGNLNVCTENLNADVNDVLNWVVKCITYGDGRFNLVMTIGFSRPGVWDGVQAQQTLARAGLHVPYENQMNERIINVDKSTTLIASLGTSLDGGEEFYEFAVGNTSARTLPFEVLFTATVPLISERISLADALAALASLGYPSGCGAGDEDCRSSRRSNGTYSIFFYEFSSGARQTDGQRHININLETAIATVYNRDGRVTERVDLINRKVTYVS